MSTKCGCWILSENARQSLYAPGYAPLLRNLMFELHIVPELTVSFIPPVGVRQKQIWE